MNESKKHHEDAGKENTGEKNKAQQEKDNASSDQDIKNKPNTPDDEAEFENPDDDPA